MVLDKNIQAAANQFGITCPEDWQEVPVAWLRQVKGVGPSTIDHLRIYLAARGLTLKNDATPAFWQENLSAAKIGTQISPTDRAVSLPFTILVDTREQHPFTFQGHLADADQNHRPLLIPVEHTHLGDSHGDYSIKGMDDCFIERKSLDDAQGTFLSHGERRDAFIYTLEFLASIECGAVVIEASFQRTRDMVISRGTRSKETLMSTIHGQVLAWTMDYRVPFIFCDTRRFAEETVLKIMRRHYKYKTRRAELEDREQAKFDTGAVSKVF